MKTVLSIAGSDPCGGDPGRYTSGSALMKSCAVSKLCKEILPLATLVTPNLSEAEILSDCVISNSEEMKYAAKKSVRYTDVRYLRQLPPILQKDFH